MKVYHSKRLIDNFYFISNVSALNSTESEVSWNANVARTTPTNLYQQFGTA